MDIFEETCKEYLEACAGNVSASGEMMELNSKNIRKLEKVFKKIPLVEKYIELEKGILVDKINLLEQMKKMQEFLKMKVG